MKNKVNLPRAVASLNAKQRNELGDVFPKILIAAREVTRDQTASELSSAILNLLVQDYLPGIVVRCSLMESLYQEILGARDPKYRTSITRSWLMERHAVYAQKQAEEEAVHRAYVSERRKVYESLNVEAILEEVVDIPLERDHLAACEVLYSQEWNIVQGRLLSGEEIQREALKKVDRTWWKGLKSVSLRIQEMIAIYEQLQPLNQFQAWFDQSSTRLAHIAKKTRSDRVSLSNSLEDQHTQLLQENEEIVRRQLEQLVSCMQMALDYVEFVLQVQELFIHSSGCLLVKEEEVAQNVLVTDERESYQKILSLFELTPAIVTTAPPPVIHQPPIWRSNNPYRNSPSAQEPLIWRSNNPYQNPVRSPLL